jgi:hypothetical protein
VPAPLGQDLRLAVEDFLGHLRDGLISSHAILLPKGCSHRVPFDGLTFHC